MFTLTVSLKPELANAEVIAQIVRLLAGLENSSMVVSGAEPRTIVEMTSPDDRPAKVRKQRQPLTEAETQIVKVRFANGRIKAALARGEEPRPQDLETVAEKVPAGTFTTVVVDSKPAKGAKKTKHQTPEQLVAGVDALIAKAKVEAKVDELMAVAKAANTNGKLKDDVKAGKYKTAKK